LAGMSVTTLKDLNTIPATERKSEGFDKVCLTKPRVSSVN